MITLNKTIKFLNKLLETDRETISKMFLERYECSQELHAHPTVQTGEKGVRVIGILNGLFGKKRTGEGKITIELDTDTNLINKFFKS
jgi:hypothetical protein